MEQTSPLGRFNEACLIVHLGHTLLQAEVKWGLHCQKNTRAGLKVLWNGRWGLLYLRTVLCCALPCFSFTPPPWESFRTGMVRKMRDIPTFPFGRAKPLPWELFGEFFPFSRWCFGGYLPAGSLQCQPSREHAVPGIK